MVHGTGVVAKFNLYSLKLIKCTIEDKPESSLKELEIKKPKICKILQLQKKEKEVIKMQWIRVIFKTY